MNKASIISLSILILLFFNNTFAFAERKTLNDTIEASPVYQTYKKDGIKAAESKYTDLKDNNTIKEEDYIVMLKIYDNNTDKFINTSKEGLKAFPKSHTIYTLLGIKYASIEKYDDAINAYTKSIELCPTEPAYYNRGQIYFAQSKYDKAISDFTNALYYMNQYVDKAQHDKAISDIYGLRAMSHNKMKNFDKSIADYDTAIKYNSTNPFLYYNRAVTKISKSSENKISKNERTKLTISADDDLDIALDLYRKSNNQDMCKKILDYKKFKAVTSVIR